MIISFGDKATEDLYHGRSTARARRFPRDLVRVALRKLDMLNAAPELLDLRVNDQWRVVFRWSGRGAHDVRLTDYH